MIHKIILISLFVCLAQCQLRLLTLSNSDKALYEKCISDNSETSTPMLAVVAKLQQIERPITVCESITTISKSFGMSLSENDLCQMVQKNYKLRKVLFNSENEIEGGEFECKVVVNSLRRKQIEEEKSLFQECYDVQTKQSDVTVNIVVRLKNQSDLKKYCDSKNSLKSLIKIEDTKDSQLCDKIHADAEAREALFKSRADIESWTCLVFPGYHQHQVEEDLSKRFRYDQDACCYSVSYYEAGHSKTRTVQCGTFPELAEDVEKKLQMKVQLGDYCGLINSQYNKFFSTIEPLLGFACKCQESKAKNYHKCINENMKEDVNTVSIFARIKGTDTEFYHLCQEISAVKKSTHLNVNDDELCDKIKSDKNARKIIFGTDRDSDDFRCVIVTGSDDRYIDDCLSLKTIPGEKCAIATRVKKDNTVPFRVCSEFNFFKTSANKNIQKDVTPNEFCKVYKDNYEAFTNTKELPEILKCKCTEKASIILKSIVVLLMAFYIIL